MKNYKYLVSIENCFCKFETAYSLMFSIGEHLVGRELIRFHLDQRGEDVGGVHAEAPPVGGVPVALDLFCELLVESRLAHYPGGEVDFPTEPLVRVTGDETSDD